MAFNGSGVFNRLYNWVNDRNAGTKISATRMDAEMDGMATGLSNCITKDGQTTITAAIPFNNQKITGLADASASQDALNKRTGDATYLTLSGGTLTGPVKLTAVAVSASTVDCTAGQYFTKTAVGALTWVFSNAPTDVFTFQLELTNGGLGTQTWPASVVWGNGAGPTLSSSGVNLLTFTTSDGGSIWLGSYPGAASSGAGTVTSVAVSGGSTGLTTSGGPVTTSGTITLAGTLAVANGGTGVTTAPAAGKIPIGNGTGYTVANITSSGGLTVSNGSGTIALSLDADLDAIAALSSTPSSGQSLFLCRTGSGTWALKTATLSTSAPSGGSAGDIWYRYA